MNVLCGLSSEPFSSNGSTYLTFTCKCGSKVANILFVYGSWNYVNVHYKNAMSRAYRGHGIRFENVEAAYSHYKCPEILAMIDAADFEYRNHRAEVEEFN